ncbi:MAG: hypothetical protein WC516_08235 [Patescibacteria group bacterium]|jgi:hypothetical protein
MIYPNSGSALGSNINSGLSTQIVIKVGSTTVGAIQALTINQNRELCVWEEIGTEGIIEIHPKNATKIEISIQRIVFDELRVLESFARGFINLQAQRVPFDIHIIDMSTANDVSNALSHICHNCWFKQYSTPYNANNFLITESANLVCEYITSMRNAQNASYGGLKGISYEYDTIERNTDLTGRRGRFSSTGISK